jgi:hypothetical protein
MIFVLQRLSLIRSHRLNRWLLLAVFVIAFALFAHGCHGDADHEL